MSDRKVFLDSIVPLPADGGVTADGLMVRAAKSLTGAERMSLHFAVALPSDAQSDLEKRVARGDVVPFKELQSKYAANANDVDALVNWLKAQGFEIEQVTPDGTSVYADATVAVIEKSLEVTIVHVTKGGITYPAAQNAPSLPADVGRAVHAIIGLQPFRQVNRNSRKLMPVNANRGAIAAGGAKAPGSKPDVKNAPPYLVNEILKAYNADGLTVTGKGQTIAILIDRFPTTSDLTSFWKSNNLKTTSRQVTKVNVKGGSLPAAEGEETLDVSWSSGIAPNAKIRVYASGSLSFVDLDKALDRILADVPKQAGMRQLSISLGLGETYMGGPQGEVAIQHQKFLKLAAAGVNIFVASGDAGSNPDSSGQSATGPTQAEHPSSDPFVVAVGGTSLVLGANGAVAGETGWVSGGGGASIFFDRPAWQTGEGVPAGTKRLVPDVSMAADPNEGAFLVLHGTVQQFGGTSWSAPVWAGFCALINEARLAAKKPALPFLNPLIYPLLGTACFRDIRSGSNGAYNAGPGYDMVTGLGVPDVKELIRVLTQ